MDKRTFWTTKSRQAEYHAVDIAHPALSDVFRLVSNQFEPVTLGGNVYQPAPMTIKPPDQKGGQQAKLTLAFPRAVVGREFKRQLRIIKASGSREPITIDYSIYLGDTDVPELTWNLYASDTGGIQFTGDRVQLTATIDNLLRRGVAPIYDPAVFTGLVLI